jgi:hypothetical protein
MKKMSLQLDSLCVESFETSATPTPRRGTVRAAGATEGLDPSCGPPCEPTVGDSCWGTCTGCTEGLDPSCGPPCEPTVGDSCFGSCIGCSEEVLCGIG